MIPEGTPVALLAQARVAGLAFGVYDGRLWVQLDSAQSDLRSLAIALLDRAAELIPLLQPADVPPLPLDPQFDPEQVLTPSELALLKVLRHLRGSPLSALDQASA